MDHDLHSRLMYELKNLSDAQGKYRAEYEALGSAGKVLLKRNVHKNGHAYYYGKMPGASKYHYIGAESNLQVRKIKKAAHLGKAMENIDRNIILINSFMADYEEYDYRSVEASLPMTYRDGKNPCISAYQSIGKKWQEEKLVFQAGFPENYPERKKEQTSDGVWVKTISEVVMYERFKGAGLFQIYELPLVSKDYGPNLYPDFTILSPLDLKTEIIVEYVGRLDSQQYREDFARRIYRYMKNGYIPGVNLFFVFSDLEGHVDSLQINKVIADIRGLRTAA